MAICSPGQLPRDNLLLFLPLHIWYQCWARAASDAERNEVRAGNSKIQGDSPLHSILFQSLLYQRTGESQAEKILTGSLRAPGVPDCSCCSQRTHSQAGGTQGRRPLWSSLSWAPLIIIIRHLTRFRLCSNEHTQLQRELGRASSHYTTCLHTCTHRCIEPWLPIGFTR